MWTRILSSFITGESEREGGKIRSTNVGAMTVWQKQGDCWRLLARQAYPIK